jgi:hypothetical protein
MLPTISPAPTIATVAVLVNIHLDLFANEVSWKIVEQESGLVIVDRPFETYQYENEVTETVYLRPETDYNFTIFDMYGDGIVNKGFYRILTKDGSLMLVMGDGPFGRERTHEFRTPALDVFAAPSNAPSGGPSSPPSLIPTNLPSAIVSDSSSLTPTGIPDVDDVEDTPVGTGGSNAVCAYVQNPCSLNSDCCSQSCRQGVCIRNEANHPAGRIDGKIKDPGGTTYRPPP